MRGFSYARRRQAALRHRGNAGGKHVYRTSRSPDAAGLGVLLRAPPAAQRKCAGCEEELQRSANTPGRAAGDASATVSGGTAGGGAPMSSGLRHFFEPRFGQDLGHVRLHTDAAAAESAGALDARAYTFGRDIVFGTDEYKPDTAAGRRLLAHELVHVVQQEEAPPKARREPRDKGKDASPEKDPLCASVTALPELPAEKIEKPEQRLALVRTLKIVKRCGSAEQQTEYRKKLVDKLGEADAKALWDAADKPFGGYVGMYPEFASDMKRRLEKLGASESVAFGSFDASGGTESYRRRASGAAGGELTELARTDILYFRGHQYAQYGAPGVFTSDGSTWVDLRYVQQAGGFANVKLVISTSCATICKEALEVFTGLFPNAVLLGYRKSAPRDGKAVRDTFDQKIIGLRRGLLLDQSVDVDAIVAAWKATIQAVHAGDTTPLPGYFRGGALEYWDGKAWKTVSAMSEDNKCRRKTDHTYDLPAPV